MKKLTLLLALMLFGLMAFAQPNIFIEFKSYRSQASGYEASNLDVTITVYEDDGITYLMERHDQSGKIMQMYLVEDVEITEDGIYIVEVISRKVLTLHFIIHKNIAMVIGENFKVTYSGKRTLSKW